MSTPPCIPANPDVSGIGVRIAIYVQTFLSFIPAWWALADGEVSDSELDSLETQSTTILLTAFAMLITTMEQKARGQISNFHANIVLSLSWMNNTNTFIYFLLYVQHQSQGGLKPSWAAWWNHVWSKLSLKPNKVFQPPASSKGLLRPYAQRWISSLAAHTSFPAKLSALLGLFRSIVLTLGSLHLSMMASLGIWLWSHPASFGAESCEVELAATSILGNNVRFGSTGLRATSLMLYSLFLPLGLNLILPMTLFLGLFIVYQKWHQGRVAARAPDYLSAMQRATWRYFPHLYGWYSNLPASLSVVPIVIGLALLLTINLIFTLDIELTLRRNRSLQEPGDADWSFGQVLAMLLLVMPLRDILDGILARDDKRRRKEHTASLRNAIKEGATGETILDLVNKGADVNVRAQDSDWVTTLQLASSRGDEVLISTLLERKVQLDVRGGTGGTALHAALRGPHRGTLKLLLGAGTSVNIIDNQIGTVLQYASYKGYQDIAQLLLQHGADPDIKGGPHGTALHAAAYGDHLHILALLVTIGANSNILAGKHGTVLQVAAAKGNLRMVNQLLDAGADPNVPGGKYWTALQAASCGADNYEIVERLLQERADPDIQGGKYGTPLQAAAYGGSLHILRLLLEHGANPNIQDGEYGTALQAASADGQLDMVRLLLANEADPNIRGGRFDNALQAAAASDEPDGLRIVRLLLDLGADPNLMGGEYRTALHAAARFGNTPAVELLLEKGADRTILDDDNRTAHDLAVAGEYSTVAELLMPSPA